MLIQQLLDVADMNWGTIGGFVRIVPLQEETFDPDKEYYTLKLSLQYGELSASFEYHVTRSGGGLPALILHGQLSNSCPYEFIDNTVFYSTPTQLGMYGGSRYLEPGITATLVSSEGDTDVITSGGVPALNSLACHEYLFATSDAAITIDADFPIFGGPLVGVDVGQITQYYWSEEPTYQGYVNEIIYNEDYTNIDLALNAHGSQPEEIDEDKIYYINNSLKVNGTIVPSHSKAYRFKIDKYSRIGLYTTLPHDNDKYPNMTLKISGSKPFKYNIPTNNTWTSATSLPSAAEKYQYNANNSWTDFLNGDVCYANLSTNIKIFSSEEALDEYFDTGDANDAINGGDDDGGKESDIGGKLDGTDIPATTPGLSGTGTYVYALSLSDLKSIMSNCLYVTDSNVIDAIKEGLWLWGNNPIDFLVDLYYIPFSLSDFYTLGSANVKFGTYTFPNAGAFSIVTDATGTRVTLFNTFFSPIYGDWRDYAYVSYDLYLPFIGFVPLDASRYVGKTVKCEMMFDVTTHNIRYYLYANGIVTDRFDGSVGINMPIMSSDQVNKAKMDIQNTKDAAGNIGNTLGAIATGDIGGAISGIIESAQSMAAVAGQKTPQTVTGGFSSSMNIYDIKYAYLRISENKHYYPGNLNAVYNYPSYYIGPLSALSGYCELEDVQLNSSCTESEYDAIKQLLKEGVIF